MATNTTWALAGCFIAGMTSLACGGGDGEKRSYFAADGPARLAGHGLLLGGSVESGVLPVALDSTAAAEVVGPSVEQPIDLEPGSVVIVRGREGTLVRLNLGIDVDPDALLVQGSEEAVAKLARELGGDAQPTDLGYIVRAPDALYAVTTVAAPDGLLEVMPFETHFGAFVTDEAPLDVATRPGGSVSGADEVSAAVVAFGRAFPVCDGVAGTWQGKLYWSHVGYWYDFTLEVEQSGRDASALSGRIRARAWHGGILDADPPAGCHPGANVDHFVVEMPAAGAVSAENGVSFEGLSWRKTACSRPLDSDEYCEDRFTGKLSADGHLLHAENDDGCNPIEPIAFVRTSCTANSAP
jgi:hypothetical protein